MTKFILLYALVEGQNLNPFRNKSISCLVKFFDERFTINFLSLLTVWLDSIFVDLELTLAVTLVAHPRFLHWYQELICPVEPQYFSDEKSLTVEKQ